jgi:hypothetical protein
LLLDIVGFSKLPDHFQYFCIQTIQDLTKDQLASSGSLLPTGVKLCIGFIPTGDGFYLILHPAVAGYGPLLALALRNALFHWSKTPITPLGEGIRIAAHSGRVIPFLDINSRMNFVGDGLNDAARLLSLDEDTMNKVKEFSGDENFVVASAEAITRFNQAYGQQEECLKSFDFRQSDPVTVLDKHKKEHMVHSIELRRDSAILAPSTLHVSPEEITRIACLRSLKLVGKND